MHCFGMLFTTSFPKHMDLPSDIPNTLGFLYNEVLPRAFAYFPRASKSGNRAGRSAWLLAGQSAV